MIFQIFKNELKRNKVINITLFTFILLAALLAASAASVITMLMSSVDVLMTSCETPHFVQMHAGDVDELALDKFNSQYDYIDAFQLCETISIDGANIYFNESSESEAESVMDISFVVQNKAFDYLLDMDNQISNPEADEVVVPIYYKSQKNLKIGDTLTISHESFEKQFIISGFARDSQMNPSLVSSKRFVISQDDYNLLSQIFLQREYIIEYRFDSLERIDEFTSEYTSSDMPQTGPAVDYTLFRMLNAITDGIIVLVLILVSVLLIVIGMLCLRFTLLGSIEEDTREIGVMKAIGLPLKKIKFLYMSKYMLLSAIACIAGFLLSFWVNGIFTKRIAEYMGAVSPGVQTYLLTALCSGLVFALVTLSSYCLLSRFKKLSAVKALTSRIGDNKQGKNKGLSLKKNPIKNTNIFLGMNAVYSNLKVYVILGVIFIISTFMIIVPVNLLNTFSSPDFVNYMGVGTSDIRVDVRIDQEAEYRASQLINYIENDKDIEEFSVYKTYRAGIKNSEGETENIPLEVGDFSMFPLDYMEGRAPVNENEIGLSVLAIESIGKNVGDTIEVVCDKSMYKAKISGVYQDITNGGKTAKAQISEPIASTLWYVVNINVIEGSNVKNKAEEYSKLFDGIKVTYLEEYLDQTLGSTISQLRLVTIFAIIVSMSITSLIAALFIKMILSKERRQIAILKSIGFNDNNISVQYLSRIFIVFLTGIVIGTLLSLTLGEGLVGVVYAEFGAPGIEFVVNPFASYILCPLLLGTTALLTGYVIIHRFRPSNISRMIIE